MRGKNKDKPRPIIVRFSYYKEKELVWKNARQLRDTNITISQDFSKKTSDINKQIYNAAKTARDECDYITRFYLNYKYVTMVYNKSNRVVRKNYNLGDIVNNPHDWYKLQDF